MIAPVIPLIAGIVQLAPAIAGLFGKGEKEAKIVAELAAQVTGQSTDVGILAQLKEHPEQLLELQRLLVEEKQKQEELYVSDKANARARDAEFLRSGTRNYRADFLVGIIVVMVFTIIGIVVLKENLSEFAKGALTTLLGLTGTQLSNIFSFEFGTTRKSEEDTSKIVSDYVRS